MEIRLTRSGSTLVARPLGRWLDAQTAPHVQRAVAAAIEDGARSVVLDLGEVTTVDSAGLGAMMRLLKLIPEGGRLVLCGCLPQVSELLERSRLDSILVAYADPDAAHRAIAAGVP
jgi:anti-sigma B factor antagonist